MKTEEDLYEVIKEVELVLWEIKLWGKNEDAKDIIIKLLDEIIDIIEEHKKEGR